MLGIQSSAGIQRFSQPKVNFTAQKKEEKEKKLQTHVRNFVEETGTKFLGWDNDKKKIGFATDLILEIFKLPLKQSNVLILEMGDQQMIFPENRPQAAG